MLDCWDFKIRPKMQVLSNEEIEFFIIRAFDVIEQIGVKVLHEEAKTLLYSSGAYIKKDNIVTIPVTMVEKAIESAPKKVLIYDRDGNPAMELGGGNTGGKNTYYGTGSDLIYTYDLYSQKFRKTVSEDIALMARLVDYLPNMDFLMSYGIPSDVPFKKVYQTEFIQMVMNSTKPIVFTSDNYDVSREIIDMAAIVVGGKNILKEKPFIMNYSQPTSPLTHSEDAIGKMFASAESGIPVVYPPGLMPGVTGPVTIAGAIVQSLAEAFTALVIHQLKNENAPIILCGAHGCMDMRTSINVYAAPERLMTQAALSAIYQHFGIPTWGFGGCTDASALDEQAGAEYGMMSMWASLCGVNLAHDSGYLSSGVAGDLRAIVLSDEINSYVKHILDTGIEVNNHTLDIELMKKVGSGGSYLTEKHTFDHFRKLWEPSVFIRDNIKSIETSEGGKFKNVLKEKAKGILQNHKPKDISPEIIKEIRNTQSVC